MKINSTILEALKEDGLHIVDEDNVPFETEEENVLIHQEKYDGNTPHEEEIELDRWIRREEEEKYLEHSYLAWT